MIDINELRRRAELGYKVASDIVIELLDRLEAAEQTVKDYLRIDREKSQIAQRLEAAEKERDDVAQQLVQSEIGKRKISEERDALQVEVGKLKDLEVARCVKINGYIVDNARLVEEVERLRAKIAEMEKQEPVAEWVDSTFDQYPHLKWRDPYKAIVGAKLYTKLYALPGAQAQPAPSVPREAIEKMLTQLMDIAVSNGANSISMPDEYVEVAAWLCGIPAQPAPSIHEVTDAMALAFHAALTDGSIGDHEMEEIKAGLRAALAAAPEAKP